MGETTTWAGKGSRRLNCEGWSARSLRSFSRHLNLVNCDFAKKNRPRGVPGGRPALPVASRGDKHESGAHRRA